LVKQTHKFFGSEKQYAGTRGIEILDDQFNPIQGTEKNIQADVICLAVGLTPLTDLLWQAGCQMKFVSELGGYVPLRSECLETSIEGVFIAGDAAGVEEACSAMVEGRLAGYGAAKSLGLGDRKVDIFIQEMLNELTALREGEVGAKIRRGLEKAAM